MTITRDADFPPEIAVLFQIFKRCAEGSNTAHIIEAATNLVVLTIASTPNLSREDAIGYGEYIAQRLPDMVAHQYDRTPHPTDVVVPMQAN